jgi:hypothetical protein
MEPATQMEHDFSCGFGLKKPSAQLVHTCWPGRFWNVPLGQSVHVAEPDSMANQATPR